jgi:phosphonatase-like hydrolase
LEDYYRTAPVTPTEGCLECFEWLRSQGIAIGLTTGFYREVADIILSRLGWNKGLNSQHAGTPDTIIQASVASDEVANGRPAPDMIRRVMELTGVATPDIVVKIGDTPVDLEEGRNAGCGLTLAVTNGSHTIDQLQGCPNDGLLGSLRELKQYFQ